MHLFLFAFHCTFSRYRFANKDFSPRHRYLLENGKCFNSAPNILWYKADEDFLGYTESALRLQKEWGVQDPQKEFDFAPHVTNHALVSVLNKGLLYNASERESTRVCHRSMTSRKANP